MICETVEELTPIIGTRPACRALGASVASVYRRRTPPEPRAHRPRPTPERALSEPERERVLEVLHSERFVDVAPEETYATLLDEGTYLCSTRTMYRLLEAKHGGVRERRDQLTHPGYAKPELLAERPNELWSWDISKLKGPANWTYHYLCQGSREFPRCDHGNSSPGARPVSAGRSASMASRWRRMR
jgi:putative transposase